MKRREGERIARAMGMGVMEIEDGDVDRAAWWRCGELK